MSVDTAYFCWAEEKRVTVLECRGNDSLVMIPKEIDYMPVTALAPYLFSAYDNDNERKHSRAFWWSPQEGRISKEEAEKLQKIKGDFLEELSVPSTLEQVGSYGLYNCGKLKKLELYSTVSDWGPGVFTGCRGIRELTVHVDETCRSCLKEILAELRQTLTVIYHGSDTAKLIFPEFFEEAVENTPARILVTNTHGCGQKYRNAFVQTQFQFHEYDSLFPHVQVQEPDSLVITLALSRLMYPMRLAEEHRRQYMEYLKKHKITAACQAVEIEDMDTLVWLTEQISYRVEDLKPVIEKAGKTGNLLAVSFLMNRIGNGEKEKKRRFTL